MTLRELKTMINTGDISFTNLIFTYSDNDFLLNTYLKKISELFETETFTSLQDLQEAIEIANTWGTASNVLYITYIEKLEEITLHQDKKVIFVCKDISKELKKEYKEYIVEFPKLEKWQIEEYTKQLLPGLKPEERQWLCTITNYDIWRLQEEIDKISIFDVSNQESIFLELNKENGYDDLTELNIFNLINAIVKRNKDDVLSVLKSIKIIDVEPVGLVTLLLKQFKNILSIQSNPKVSCETLGISQKQFNAIKHNCGKYTITELIKIYDLLTSIDYKLKSGLIDNNQIIDYVICNIL